MKRLMLATALCTASLPLMAGYPTHSTNIERYYPSDGYHGTDLQFQLGAGLSHANLEMNDGTLDGSLKPAGFSLYGTAILNDNLAARLSVSGLSDNDFVYEVDSLGLDASVLVGRGLATQGFKAYGVVGYYQDDYELTVTGSDTFDDTARGYQIGAGIGYNWRGISLDAWATGRSTSDYEDAMVDVNYFTYSMGLSYRF